MMNWINILKIKGIYSMPDSDGVHKLILISMKYWEIQHLHFAYKMGIVEFIDNLQKSTEAFLNSDSAAPEIDSIELPPKIADGYVVVTQLKCSIIYFGFKAMKRAEKLGVSFYAEDKPGCGLSPYLDLTAMPNLFYYGQEMTPRQFIRQRLLEDKCAENKCGWPPCQSQMEGKELHKKMWKCKRCRLIKYCCRNHQKKHWKFIHSQQCREY